MWHDNETTLDLLDFDRFADVIATLATDKAVLPVTIGLFGDWGSGKSSILGMAEKRLLEKPGVLTLRFDGWLFEGYDDAKAALMTAILDKLVETIKKNQTLWEKTKERAKSLFRRIDWFRTAGLAAKGILTLMSPAGAALAVTQGVIEGITTVAQTVKDPAELQAQIEKLLQARQFPNTKDYHESIREFRSEFESLVKDAGLSALVVLLDDLDRCLPESVVSTLEAIKLFLSVPGTAFVIAADERVVRQAVSIRYPQQAYREYDLAQEYLDKLIQVPLVLPPLDEVDTETYVYLLFAGRGLKDDQMQALHKVVTENRRKPDLSQPLNYGILKDCLKDAATPLEADFALAASLAPLLGKNLRGNPRLVKRFLNAWSLRKHIGKAQGMSLEDGVLAKLLVLERFNRDQFTELFGWQARQGGVCSELSLLEEGKGIKKGEPGAADDVWLSDPSLKAWLDMKPSLAEKNLGAYFSLARQSVSLSISGGHRLTQEQQEVFTALQSTSQVVRRKGVERVKAMSADKLLPVYETLWAKFEANPNETAVFEGLIDVAEVNASLAARLVSSVKKIPSAALQGKSVPQFAGLGQKHPALATDVQAQLGEWSKSTNNAVARAANAVLKAKK